MKHKSKSNQKESRGDDGSMQDKASIVWAKDELSNPKEPSCKPQTLPSDKKKMKDVSQRHVEKLSPDSSSKINKKYYLLHCNNCDYDTMRSNEDKTCPRCNKEMTVYMVGERHENK
jgi:rubrerythrin